MFGQRTGAGLPDLQGITFACDQSYWAPGLLFGFLLKCGADVVGTVKRCFWFPFTYGLRGKAKMNKISDVPQFIPLKGYKNVWHKSFTYLNTKRQAVFYQSGTGSMLLLAMSSIHHERILDFNLAFPKDHKWYFDQHLSQDDRNKKAFPCYAGKEEHVRKVLEGGSHRMKPLTVTQGCVTWFYMHMFSLTSSAVNKKITLKYKKSKYVQLLAQYPYCYDLRYPSQNTSPTLRTECTEATRAAHNGETQETAQHSG
jgi:hypothetical protein